MEDFLFDKLVFYGFFNQNISLEDRKNIIRDAVATWFLRLICNYNAKYDDIIMVDGSKLNDDSFDYLTCVIKDNLNKPFIYNSLKLLQQDLSEFIEFSQGQKLNIETCATTSRINVRTRSNYYESLIIPDNNEAILNAIIGEFKILMILYDNNNYRLSNTFRKLKNVELPVVGEQYVVDRYQSLLEAYRYSYQVMQGINTGWASILDEYIDISSMTLDACLGVGVTSTYLKSIGVANLYACDLRTSYRDIAKSVLAENRWFCNYAPTSLLRENPYRDAQFGNIVYGDNFFCQLPTHEDRLKVLREMHRILKPRGRVIITTTDLQLLSDVNPSLANRIDRFIGHEKYIDYGFNHECDYKVRFGGFMNYDAAVNYSIMFDQAGFKVSHLHELDSSTSIDDFDHNSVGRAFILEKK